MRLHSLLALALVAPLALHAQTRTPADLIVTNARIYTVDANHPFVSALAVRDGKVQFVGSVREALLLRGPSTKLVDAGGQTIIPGMVDAHAHLFELGTFLHNLDLKDTRSYEQIVNLVAARVKETPAG